HLTSLVLRRTPPPSLSPLVPYTTLFRSSRVDGLRGADPSLPDPDRLPGRGPRAPAPGQRGGGSGPAAGASRRSHGCGHRRAAGRSEEHTSELQSRFDLVCRLLLEKKNYT